MNAEKLKKLQAQTKATGKGQPRRKVVKKPKGAASAPGDDKKLQGALKKLNVVNMQGIEEVNMFKDEGSKILHFSAPKVHGAANANTFAVYGTPQEKDLTELVPGILPQLGADSIANLRRLATSLGGLQENQGGHAHKEADDDDDDDVPDLVENFDVEETKDSKFESVD